MSTRLPPLLRGKDPLSPRGQFAKMLEARTAQAVTRVRSAQRQMLRPPPLLLLAGGVDALGATTEEHVDLLHDRDLATAAHRAGIELSAVDEAQREVLRGYVSAVRGAAGELFVVDKLATGELPVPSGSDTVELQDFTRPGADLVFSADDAGAVAANVKIAADADVIIRHFDRYSDDVPIVYATSDAAADASRRGYEVVESTQDVIDVRGPVVVDLGMPSSAFDKEIDPRVSGAQHLDSESILDQLPWFSFGVIGVRAVRRLQKGASFAEAMSAPGRDGVRSISSLAAGRTVIEAGGGEPTAFVASVVAGWLAHASLEVRRAWRQHAERDELLAQFAEGIAMSWQESAPPSAT